ncbi:MAG: aromatic amino acid lyase [Eubacterium sp.]|nr:aromatic amino acid lyase [Eubacterium sp.]
MKYVGLKNKVVLGTKLSLEDLIAIARFGAFVDFNKDFKERVIRSRELVDEWTAEGKIMYGITTGFGKLCSRVINEGQANELQHNIITCHSTSVGEPYTIEQARAVMVMILQNLGQGYAGVRLEVLEKYKEFLNKGVTPWAPREGSVGYLAPEAHMARVLEGNGKAYFDGKLMDASEALKAAGIEPIALASKEGLALVSGTTSATALGALALYDMIKGAVSADIVAALSFEASKGQLDAICEEVMSVRPHPDQANTAKNLRMILAGSKAVEEAQGDHLQDALSFRCIPQLHGAAKKTLYDALKTLETEMNSCCDNPIIWPEKGAERAISACNPDSSYIGIEMDSCAIAATDLAKMSERRNNHMIDENLSGYPSFLIKDAGLNSGLMIPQYTQAGLINDMRIMCWPGSVDNTPTCVNQEDYVAMGYNSAKKCIGMAEKLEYVLAIELLSSYETRGFIQGGKKRSPVSEKIYKLIAKKVPLMEKDEFLYDYIEYIRDLIHSGRLVDIVQKQLNEELL